MLQSNLQASPLKNVIVLLTDGEQDTDDEADKAREKLLAAATDGKQAGMAIVVIRAGRIIDTDPAQVKTDMKLVSGPGTGLYFEAEQFDQAALQRLADGAAKAACGAAEQPGG